MEKIKLLKPANGDCDTAAWAKEHLEIINALTNLDLEQKTIVNVCNGFLVKNKILEQTFFVKCDNKKSSVEDLGHILTGCALFNAQGIIWLANDPGKTLKDVFKWLNTTTSSDFETYLIEIET